MVVHEGWMTKVGGKVRPRAAHVVAAPARFFRRTLLTLATQSDAQVKSWQKRFFVLRSDGTLTYSKEGRSKRAVAIIAAVLFGLPHAF